MKWSDLKKELTSISEEEQKAIESQVANFHKPLSEWNDEHLNSALIGSKHDLNIAISMNREAETPDEVEDARQEYRSVRLNLKAYEDEIQRRKKG